MRGQPVVDAVRGGPGLSFPRQLTYRHALGPLVVMMGAAAALSYAYRPYFGQALAVLLPPDISPAALDGLQSQAFRFSLVGSAIVPLVRVGIGAALAFLVLTASASRDDVPRFQGLSACAAWAALLLTVKDAARYVVLTARGVEAVRDVTDLRPGVGLGFLLADARSPLFGALDAVNAFDLGYVFVLAWLIARSERVPPWHAFAAAAVPWLLMQAVVIGFGAVLPR